MSKLTPRDLFNPPPQAGERGGYIIPPGGNGPDGKINDSSTFDVVYAKGGLYANPLPYVVGESCEESKIFCDCQSSPHHPQCITRRFSCPVPAGETMRSAVSVRDGVRTVIGEIPRKLTGMSDASLNTLLNIAAGGYRLTGICEGCKGTGLCRANYDPCIVVGCISRTDERVKVLVSEGKTIEAIRLHRSLHDVGLLEAKLFIDKLRGWNV